MLSCEIFSLTLLSVLFLTLHSMDAEYVGAIKKCVKHPAATAKSSVDKMIYTTFVRII